MPSALSDKLRNPSQQLAQRYRLAASAFAVASAVGESRVRLCLCDFKFQLWDRLQ